MGDNDKSCYVWGVVVGVIVGGVIGNYMDKQEEELCVELVDMGVDIVWEGDILYLIMFGDIMFVINSVVISFNFNLVFNDVVIVLNNYEKIVLMIKGYIDDMGFEIYNQVLFECCVNVVKNLFVVYNVNV